MRNFIRKCEFRCGFIILLLGLAFYFAYDWSGTYRPLGAIFPVNGSIWEYCKMAFWPAWIISIFEYFFIRSKTYNFAFGKASMLFVTPLLMITMYYTYSGILGYDIFIVNVAIYLISIILGQYLSYKILVSRKIFYLMNTLSSGIIMFMMLAFSVPTFFPPEIALFRDVELGIYGIPYR